MNAEHTVDSARDAELFGYLVEFDKVDELLVGAAAVRDAGYTQWDAHTPFVIHGLDAAMGIKPTKLPFLVFGAGLTGCAAGIGLQWFTNAYDYPFLISGKPIFSLPANIPVAFEMTILFSAISALVGMLAFNGLPQLSHPLHGSRLMKFPSASASSSSSSALMDSVRLRLLRSRLMNLASISSPTDNSLLASSTRSSLISEART